MRLFAGLAFLVLNFYFLLTPLTFAHSDIVVVKMTPFAFEPAKIEVDVNSTVMFLNQDTTPRWPASDYHPTHDVYSEFDPLKEILPGASWSFKPKKAGIWSFHDHLNPHLKGILTINAEENNLTSTDIVQQKSNLSLLDKIRNVFNQAIFRIQKFFSFFKKDLNADEFKKLAVANQIKSLEDMAKKNGSVATWSFITGIFKNEAGSSGNIHDLAHLGGKLIYDELGISGISNCTPNFAFGCYHGFLDIAFKKSLEELKQAELECEKLGPVNSGPYGSCIHGIGHGVASFHQTLRLEDALTSCNMLSNGQGFCHDGVFMEFERGAPASFYPVEKPFYPCDLLEEKFGDIYSLSCGRNQPTVFVSRFGMPFDEAVKLCGNNRLTDKFKSSCFDAIGFMLASTGNPVKIISGCQSITNSGYSAQCLRSAAGELIFQEVTGWEEKSQEVCAASVTKADCQENLMRIIWEYGRKPKGFLNFLPDTQSEEKYVRSKMGSCLSGGSRDVCYKQAANFFSQMFGLKKTLAIFASNEQYPEIFSRCHEATHYLSRNEYQKTDSVPAVYSICDSTCHGGCYHGVLEQYLKDKNLQDNELGNEFSEVCGIAEDYESPLVYNECMHGLGHAAMFVTDMEVLDSLKLCDTLPAQKYKERCYSGVFMENSSSSTNNEHPGKYLKADDPFFPCNVLEEKYLKLCYRYQSSYFALITNHDWQKTAELCLRVPSEYQNDCFRTIGTNQVGFTQNTAQMRANCDLMPSQSFQEVCYTGVISSFAYRFVEDIGRMENFCSSLQKNFQEACFRQIGTSVTDWSKDKEKAYSWCTKINNSEFSSWCKIAMTFSAD